MKAAILTIFGFLSLCLVSCVDHEKEDTLLREKLVAEGVEIKISEFKQREWDKCVEQARMKAVAKADSIIRALAKQEAVEPVQKPPKPERPEKPAVKILPDSIRQKAVIEPDSIINQR